MGEFTNLPHDPHDSTADTRRTQTHNMPNGWKKNAKHLSRRQQYGGGASRPEKRPGRKMERLMRSRERGKVNNMYKPLTRRSKSRVHTHGRFIRRDARRR